MTRTRTRQRQKEDHPATFPLSLRVPLNVPTPTSLPGLYEEVATITASDGKYRIGRCTAGTALHIFRPNGPRLVIAMVPLLRAIMDEVFALQRKGTL